MNLKINELKTSIENVIFIVSCLNFNLTIFFLKKTKLSKEKKENEETFLSEIDTLNKMNKSLNDKNNVIFLKINYLKNT